MFLLDWYWGRQKEGGRDWHSINNIIVNIPGKYEYFKKLIWSLDSDTTDILNTKKYFWIINISGYLPDIALTVHSENQIF